MAENIHQEEVHQQKFLRGTPKHLSLSGILHPGSIISLNNTERRQCRFDCIHCGNKDAPYASKKLSAAKQKKIIETAKQQLNTATFVLAGEGDPMCDRNLCEIVKHTYTLGMTTVMFNTADLIDKEKATFLRDHDVTLILSLPDNEEEMYDRFVRRPGAYKRIISNIRAIADAYKGTTEEIKGIKTYRVAFNTGINAQNYTRREGVQRSAKELDIMSILNYPWIEGEATRHTEELVGGEVTAEMTARGTYPTIHSTLMRIVFQESENRGFGFIAPDMTCGMESYGLSIGVDGRLQQCPYRVNSDENEGHIDDYKNADGTYNLRRALEDKSRFWKDNRVNICSLRHGGEAFKEKLRGFFKNV